MLRAALTPFRSMRSAGRTLLALLAILVPVVGSMWLTGWMLDLQRSVAWGTSKDVPSFDVNANRLTTGLWATVVSLVWILPLSAIIGVLGTGLVSLRVIGPMTEQLNSLAATPYQDPYVMQQQITVVMVESLVPAIGLILLLGLAGGILMAPLVQAATVRYNLYRVPREGFRLGEVFRSLPRGGMTTVKAIAFSLAPMLIQIPLLAFAWRYIGEAVGAMGLTADPARMIEAAAGYGAFVGISWVASFLGAAMQAIQYSAWGWWAREAYRLEPPGTGTV